MMGKIDFAIDALQRSIDELRMEYKTNGLQNDEKISDKLGAIERQHENMQALINTALDQ